ncbi:hypothetical protein [Actinokineospora sp.]|uniref:hypothetical protein n=1 Tax=Actinokineospora sp. TaxID=1872133 RepID=UPI004037690F
MTPAIYDHIVAHLDPGGCGLLPGGDTLPDEDPADDRVRWASGARDGALGHHMARGDDGASDLPDLVEAAVRDAGYAALYDALCAGEVLARLDDVLRGVRAAGLPADGLHALGTRLVTEARHREPVKFGIALLGLGDAPADAELLLRVGRHEEFTLFAAVAIRNTHPAAEPVLLSLARGVRGWGRIGVVERFDRTASPQVRDWLLRGGFRNSVMDEYLAHQAATVGGLVDALAADDIDGELLAAACDIVSALIEGGPAEDIDDYPDAPLAVRLLVGHLERRADTVHHFGCVARVERFLADDGWAHRYQRGWDLALHDALVRRCLDLLARPLWRNLVAAGLESADDKDFHAAAYAAGVLGIDTFDAWLRRVRGTEAGWFGLMAQATDERLPAILRLAEDTPPLAELSTGPADVTGLGPRWSAHAALDTVVTGLREFPGQGVPLVLASLRCPVVRNRIMAVKTLTGWGPAAWLPDVQAALRHAVDDEPDAGLRESMRQLLTGPSSTDPAGRA